ncbi:Peptidase A2 domain-containing protein [Rubrivivax sp. A210]|uniref:retropepsin-like aspartic protease family protein n=1 Tax=Rubrivivax sp. A210 TaxID=2772301 RepID=UPI0019191F41|nr:retropepsin-like aspartic protease [Rubrivivax sp. A210]CAD5370319.1 Peptidase A2 domain-containing protein [Rubrivivax sp. A210]
MQAWQAEQQRARFHAAAGVIELRRGPDGHFHWPGRVGGEGGVAVDFLVDTGATRTALPLALAQRAGLVLEGRTQSATAGGVVLGHVARADIRLEGGVSAERLPVTVLPELAAPLLGMDLLSKMRFSQQGGVLRFEPAS